MAGIKVYNEYISGGQPYKISDISFNDYLDYWIKNYCEVNLSYNTIQVYTNIVKNYIKPKVGVYRLSPITICTLHEFINSVYIKKRVSKNFF